MPFYSVKALFEGDFNPIWHCCSKNAATMTECDWSSCKPIFLSNKAILM